MAHALTQAQGLTARVDYGLLIFLSGIFMIGYYKGCDCLSQIGTSGLSLPPLPVAGWYQNPPLNCFGQEGANTARRRVGCQGKSEGGESGH